MYALIEKFQHFLFADVRNEKETKDMAVLIRIVSCIMAVYYLYVGVFIAFLQHYILGLTMIGMIGLVLGAFICTYEDRTFTGLVLLNLTILASSTLLTLGLGFSLGFYMPAFINILLVYFNKTEHMRWKRIYSVALMIYLMVLTEICDIWPYRIAPRGQYVYVLQMSSVLVFSCLILAAAYSFCNKFNQAEEKLRRINENLERMANYDPLTQLSNRRHMNEKLAGVVFDYNRTGKIFTMAIGDIDHFKRVNDTYGHDTGDYVLSTVAGIFREYMKDKGLVARWGGEEFLFAFENKNIDKAYQLLDELRQRIEATPMDFKEFHFHVTMTYGLEEYNARLGIEATINRADHKLYKGKEGGRNQVVR